MIHNDVLRSLRYMLAIDDTAIVGIVALGGGTVARQDITNFLKREDEPGYALCNGRLLGHFLDGLIIQRRGLDETAPPRPPEKLVTNNTVLKKLRVAFELKEDDMLELMAAGGFNISRPELTALFRNPTHKNYRDAGDQFLRNFLKMLTARVRG